VVNYDVYVDETGDLLDNESTKHYGLGFVTIESGDEARSLETEYLTAFPKRSHFRRIHASRKCARAKKMLDIASSFRTFACGGFLSHSDARIKNALYDVIADRDHEDLPPRARQEFDEIVENLAVGETGLITDLSPLVGPDTYLKMDDMYLQAATVTVASIVLTHPGSNIGKVTVHIDLMGNRNAHAEALVRLDHHLKNSWADLAARLIEGGVSPTRTKDVDVSVEYTKTAGMYPLHDYADLAASVVHHLYLFYNDSSHCLGKQLYSIAKPYFERLHRVGYFPQLKSGVYYDPTGGDERWKQS
jgi:hypothetical protein